MNKEPTRGSNYTSMGAEMEEAARAPGALGRKSSLGSREGLQAKSLLEKRQEFTRTGEEG